MSTSPPISFVLYITPESKGCVTAQTLLKQYPPLRKEVHIQDIRLIEKPEWLRGVPVLAKIITREIWEGSAALEQLHYLAGYYSALSALPSAQPWSMYNTNLTLPKSVDASNPTEPLPQVPPQPQIPTQPQALPPLTQQIPPQPQSPTPTQSQQRLPPHPPRSASPSSQLKADPNRFQPIPLPDDQRPQQELNLPPLPVLRKRDDQPVHPPLSSSPSNTSQPLVSSSAGVQTRRMIPTLRPANVTDLVRSPPDLVRSPPDPTPPLPQPQLEDHVAMVFSEDELNTIQRVMFKPKTVNKRHQLSDVEEHSATNDGDIDSKVRVFPLSERVRHTIVQKEDADDTDDNPPSQT